MSARTLDSEALGHLRVAGEWGLLRDLRGWTVCLTGRTSMERTAFAALIEAAGGSFTNSMSASVRLLVAADQQDQKSRTKLDQARVRGIRVMSEQEFVAELLPTPDELLSGMRAGFLSAQ